MNAGLLNLLRRLVEKGKLTVVFSSGEKVVLGDGTGKPAPSVSLMQERKKPSFTTQG